MNTDISSDDWPPPGCPPLAWPDLPNRHARLRWYRSVILAYAALWEEHDTQARLAPRSDAALSLLEERLNCALPPSLRQYHRELGAISLAEQLCSVDAGAPTPIQPLLDAYPGITDLLEESKSEADLALVEELIAFGDYLGNGNMFCFHRKSGEVYYFDHDGGAMLTRFFSTVEQYLDALMLLCLAQVHDDDETGERLLVQRFGESIIKKWQY